MNYTKTIREFCFQNKGEIFDVSYMGDKYFEMVPYKTLLKILNRLEDEGIVTCVSKGVYLIREESRELDEAIIDRFISNGHGMYSGYTLFNELEITEQQNDCVEIYTNRISSQTKRIGDYQLTRIDLPFTPQVISMITLLECIEKGPSIIDVSIIRLHEIIDAFAQDYTDQIFGLVIGTIPYHYSTTVTLRELLDRKGVENDCITVFERHRMQ